MEFHFSFKHMETSDSLKSYAEEKIREKVEKFITKPIKTQVTFSIDRHDHIARCIVTGGNGVNLQVEHISEDMYASIDKMLDKLETQLKRHKEKSKTRKNPLAARNKRSSEPNLPRPKKRRKRNFDIDSEEIDAEDILKFEIARKRVNSA